MNASRFQQLWQRNVDGEQAWDAVSAYQHLVQLYAETRRVYHNADHINLCLHWFDRYRHTLADADAVELAIWFHDACYGPEPSGHESRSAGLFRHMSDGGLTLERQDKICQLIMATTHQQPPADDDAALLVDIDLASFARPWHPYLKDTARCRAERKHMPDLEFCNCQIGFLQSLLARDSIYYSAVFKQHHEQQARDNVRRLLHLLRQRTAAA